MGRIKRGNYLFYTFIGDHGHHVHVFRDFKEILKWDIEREEVLSGKMKDRILKILLALKTENKI